jgi:hypothetical protein
MATFQKDAAGKWVIANSAQNEDRSLYLLACVACFSILSIAFLRPAFAASSPKNKALSAQPEAVAQKQLISPTYGKIKLGAFAGEAANLAGLTYISTTGLADKESYSQYRKSILATYGVDLEDMNYFSLAPEKLEHRLTKLKAWILLAGEYGDVTLAIEPLGKSKYKIFEDKKTMQHLAAIFDAANEKNITIWVRFASESNLRGSEYSALNNPEQFYNAAAIFKSQMPKNVKLVFSPLINTYIIGRSTQKPLAQKMLYGPNKKNIIWDRIGGTIYRTDRPLTPMYDTYYKDLRALAPNTPFQICEVGGPYSRKAELLRFLDSCSQGNFPQLVKVNLFARNINQRADPDAEFGYLEPKARSQKIELAKTSCKPQQLDSFLKPILKATL